MAKKRAKRGKNKPFRNGDVRRQTLRRRAGDVKRVELILKADNPRDQYIADNLNKLEHGTASEYVRQAIEEKIAREIAGEVVPAYPTMTPDDMRAIVADEIQAQFDGLSFEQFQGQRATFGGKPPPSEPANTVQSTGIDVSRPRARKKLPPVTVPHLPDAPEELTEADQIRMGYEMAMSIKKAQPMRADNRR